MADDMQAQAVAAQIHENLSPRAFAGGADNIFAISMKELHLIQIFVANVSSLPMSAADLQRRLGAPLTSLGPNVEPMLALFRTLNSGAQEWRAQRIPVIKGCARDIARYSDQIEDSYVVLRGLVSLLTTCAAGEDDELQGQILDDLDDRIGQLNAQCREFAGNAAKAGDGSTRLVEGLRRIGHETEQLTTAIEGSLKGRSKELEALNAEMEELSKKIGELNTQILNHQRRIEKHKKLVWIPFAGLVYAGLTLGDLAAMQKKAGQLKAAYELAQQNHRHLAAAYSALALLRVVKVWIASIDKDLDQVLPVLGRVRGIWDAIANDLYAVSRTLRRIVRDPDPVPILMEMNVESVIAEWTAFGGKAHAFCDSITLPVEALPAPELPAPPAPPAPPSGLTVTA